MVHFQAITEAHIHRLYAAFNAQDADAMLAHFAPDVNYPNGNKRMHGHDQIRAYWRDLWGKVEAHDTVTAVDQIADDLWAIRIDQTVRSMHGSILSTDQFIHHLQFTNGLLQRLDIHPQ